jgi:repressor LexA
MLIRRSVAESGAVPTQQEIGAAVGLVSTSAVAYHISQLERKGFLPKRPPELYE